MLAEDAIPLAHCFEEEGKLAQEAFGIEAVFALEKTAENTVGKKADRVREKTKEQAHEEVRDFGAGCTQIAVFDFEPFGERLKSAAASCVTRASVRSGRRTL